MNATTFSKENNKKSKKNRTISGQQSQQTPTTNQPLTTVDSTFQSSDHYDELFPPLNESTLSQASNSSHHSSEVCTGFLFSVF